ncbi:hypothetical protein CPB86DRAFT_692883 [Serendipita vermifera]|nr:hypothetical protein CPB86DRAFT_692883 [Serendipita vermifera]
MRPVGESVCHDIQHSLQTEILRSRPIQDFKDKLRSGVFEAITANPLQYTHATPAQVAFLNRLPGLIESQAEQAPSSQRDILAISAKEQDASLAYLVSALEKTRRMQQADVGSHAEKQVAPASNESQVGTLIMVPSLKDAMDIAKKATILLSGKDATIKTGIKLLVDGQNEQTQWEEWTQGRRDIVVATPGRLRHLLITVPSLKGAFCGTQLLILDRTDVLMNKSLRDDIDAVVTFLPKYPRRQTFIITEQMSYAVKQLSSRLLTAEHLIIDAAPELKTRNRRILQAYTVLPDSGHQFPYLIKLLAHDQLKYPDRSRVVVFCSTTRMAQLLMTLITNLRAACLPAGESTNVYSLHPLVGIQDREASISNFSTQDAGCSVLITADLSLRNTKLATTTRVVQLGIPSSDPGYHSKINQVTRRSTVVDLVILPWERGYLTWNLMDVPLFPIAIERFNQELAEMAEKSSLKSMVDGIEDSVQGFLPTLSREDILSAFVSLLGYYVPRCSDLRVDSSAVVEHIADWSTKACKLPKAPFISNDFLDRLQKLYKNKGSNV